ncbi:hypothetical protein NECAME_02839 [Necator americanus]|uniref:Uncharacterized protein n=1 Tax=Necator americanus TaxID=51031 RepID=W2TBX0_NECAM|nr:hypothetical protein NECAME_02839 [Necator americanus]ETN78691.1 hypothetical protein NECAME_02839 [Necator americanus]
MEKVMNPHTGWVAGQTVGNTECRSKCELIENSEQSFGQSHRQHICYRDRNCGNVFQHAHVTHN